MNNPLQCQTSKWKRSSGDWKGIVEACAAATKIAVFPHIIDDGPVAGIPQPDFESPPDDLRAVFCSGPAAKFHLTIPFSLDERQQRSLIFFKQYGRITIADLQRLRGVIESAARYNLEELVKIKVLQKQIRKKSVWYELMFH